MTIARDLGFDVEVGNILRSDLYTADEAFLTGTAAEVVPIASVDDRVVGRRPARSHHPAHPGGATTAAVRGQVDRYKDWVEHVG